MVRILERLSAERGYPAFIRSDNGPEFIAATLTEWARDDGVTLDFIQPGKPMQNGFIEWFNKTLRTEILDMYLFRSLSEVHALGILNITKNARIAHWDMFPQLFMQGKN